MMAEMWVGCCGPDRTRPPFTLHSWDMFRSSIVIFLIADPGTGYSGWWSKKFL